MENSQFRMAEPVRSLQRALAQIWSYSVAGNGNQGELFAVMVFFFTFAVASVIWLVSLRKKPTPPPPGSFGLPFIGDTIGYLSAYQTMNTRKWFEEKRRKYGPVFKASILFRTIVFLDEPGGCKLVLGQLDDKLIAGVCTKSLRGLIGPAAPIVVNGQVHATYRKYILNHFLGVDSVGRYLPIMEQKAIDHIQRYWLSKEDETSLSALAMLEIFTFSIVTDLLFSMKDVAGVEELRSIFNVYSWGMLSLGVNLPGFQYHRSLKCREKIHEVIQAKIEARRSELQEGRATTTQDYMSILLTQPTQQGHFYTDEEMRDILTSTLWSASDTTANTMCMVLRAVSKHSEVYKELIEEHRQIAANKAAGELLTRQEVRSMKYTWAVIQETLRLTPILTDISRQAMADIPYKGYVIPKGYKLVCSAAQSMWNSEVYPNPEEFNPSRFILTGATKNIEPYTFLGFGGSTRICPGQEFAKLSMLTFFHHFFKTIQYTMEEPEEKVLYRFLVYPEKGLPLRIQKCKLY